jgi:photosystem II stability/assembly factor-like uncharacterized protein
MAFDAVDPRLMYMTDGLSVMRTTDDGCTWELVWKIPDAPTPDFPVRPAIAEMVTPDHPSAAGRVYLLVEDTGGNELGSLDVEAASVRLVVSLDGGRTWEVRSLPQGAFGVAIAPSDPERMYMTVALDNRQDAVGTRHSAGKICARYASDDGGRTWEEVTDPIADAQGRVTRVSQTIAADPTDDGVIGEAYRCQAFFVVDPLNKDEIWAYGSAGGVSHSLDGGRTFTLVENFDRLRGNAYITEALDVIHEPGKPSTVRVWARGSSIWASTDGGNSWFQQALPVGDTSPWEVDFGPQLDDYLVRGYNSRSEGSLDRLESRTGQWGSILPDHLKGDQARLTGTRERIFRNNATRPSFYVTRVIDSVTYIDRFSGTL